MAQFRELTVIEQRAVGRLCWLTVHEPDLAAGVRAGQYFLVRCADPSSADPLLRRVLYVAGVDRGAGTLAFLYAPDERGTAWLARQGPGTALDGLGPVGTPFNLQVRSRNLLLVGSGAAMGSLLLLAHEAIAHGSAVVFVAAADAPDALPPPFLLPVEVEYQASGSGAQAALPLLDAGRQPGSASGDATLPPLAWADQVCAAVPHTLVPPLAELVRTNRLRWRPGFAQVLPAGDMPCGMGTCLACLVETRNGLRTRCKDGPVFDLRDVIPDAGDHL